MSYKLAERSCIRAIVEKNNYLYDNVARDAFYLEKFGEVDYFI